MLKCPFCENVLSTHTTNGWECECGEMIPFGLETDSEDNCENCPMLHCPKRTSPFSGAVKN